MKYLKQFTIILAVSFVGEILHKIISLPIPSSIYGIVLLFFLLETKQLPVEAVAETGKFLLEIMPVMFIPAAVGIIDAWDVIRPSLLSYAMITFVSTVLVMVSAGKVTQAIIKKGKARKTDD